MMMSLHNIIKTGAESRPIFHANLLFAITAVVIHNSMYHFLWVDQRKPQATTA